MQEKNTENKKQWFWSILFHGVQKPKNSSDTVEPEGSGQRPEPATTKEPVSTNTTKPEASNQESQPENPIKPEKVVEKPKVKKQWFWSILFHGVKKTEDNAVESKEGDNKTVKKEEIPDKEEISGEKLKEVEKIYKEWLVTIKDMIAPSSMEVAFDHIKMWDNLLKSFFVYYYPRFINENWLSPIINMDKTMDISMFIYPHDSWKMLKTLRNKVTQMRSTISILREKWVVRDPEIEASLEDAETMRDQLQRWEEKFFQFWLYFTIYDKDKELLNKTITQFETSLWSKLILTKRADMQMERWFNSTQPMCLDQIEITRNMNTSPLSSSFPFSSSDLTSDKWIMYWINRHNDSLIIFDRFSLPNWNSIVLSTSWAWKSYTVKLEILRLMMFNTDVIVIDPENEYQNLCEAIWWTYISISLNSKEKINPFDLPEWIKDNPEIPWDLLRSAIIEISWLLSVMLWWISPEESALIDKGLIDTYAIKWITFETQNPWELEAPLMSDLFKVLNSMQWADSLAKRLEKFVNGSYAWVFNKATNIDLWTWMVVFNIRDLEEELRPVAMHMLLNFVWKKIRSKLKKRVLVIDEAWKIMQYEASAKFLYWLVKRARKYYLWVTTITQDVEDFMWSDYWKPIVTNSSIQILLKQAPSSIEVLKKTFNLTEWETYLLLNSWIWQWIFFAWNKHAAIQIIASYSEDKLITTNPEDILKNEASEKSEEERGKKKNEKVEKKKEESEKVEEKEKKEEGKKAKEKEEEKEEE